MGLFLFLRVCTSALDNSEMACSVLHEPALACTVLHKNQDKLQGVMEEGEEEEYMETYSPADITNILVS